MQGSEYTSTTIEKCHVQLTEYSLLSASILGSLLRRAAQNRQPQKKSPSNDELLMFGGP
ncbi:MAG: hypothetical protein RI942_560 [Pseudomonadota bacterium]